MGDGMQRSMQGSQWYLVPNHTLVITHDDWKSIPAPADARNRAICQLRDKVVEVAKGPRNVFFVWMLHGSTKVVVRAVALLSAKTK